MEQFVLFGAGLTGSGAIRYFDKQIVAVIDNDVEKQGKDFWGIPIISLEIYKKRYSALQILLSVYNERYFDVINQLSSNGISNYFTVPPVIYGYPLPEEFADVICAEGYTQVFFDNLNPISKRMICCLQKKKIKYIIGINNLKNSSSINGKKAVVFTTNETESGLRKKTINILNSEDFQIYDLYEELGVFDKLRKFKNIYLNKKCFIVGNGPSLTVNDLNMLRNKNVISFASNGIYNIYSLTEWRPSFYTIIDILALERFQKGLDDIEPEHCFLASCRYIDNRKKSGFSYFSVKNYISQDEELEFSKDIAKYIVSGKTVTYAMLQIACYMGFKEIYLLGIDWTGGKNTGKARFDFYDKDTPSVNIGSFDMIAQEEKAYISAKKYTDQNGVKIYNATRGGELEIFERVDFDKVIGEWNNE